MKTSNFAHLARGMARELAADLIDQPALIDEVLDDLLGDEVDELGKVAIKAFIETLIEHDQNFDIVNQKYQPPFRKVKYA